MRSPAWISSVSASEDGLIWFTDNWLIAVSTYGGKINPVFWRAYLTRVLIPFMRQVSPENVASPNTTIQMIRVSVCEVGNGRRLDLTEHLIRDQGMAVIPLIG